MDLAVKWRFFRHLLSGSDPDAVRVYKWHILKRSGKRMQAGLATDVYKGTIDDYIVSAAATLGSMNRYGFKPEYALVTDPNGEILTGAHRLAAALALEIKSIPVEKSDRRVWAPPWNYDWFVRAGMNASDLTRLSKDFQEISGSRHT